jgi:hypothetical protein
LAALAFRDPRRILKRKDTGQLNIDEVQAQIDVELAKQARAHLGYDATPMLKRAELTRALARLRIEPFTEKTVERYKRRVINNNRPLLFRNPIAHVLGAPAESSSLWPFVFALAATILSFLYGMVGAFFNTPGVVHAWQFAGGAFAWMVFGFLYAGSGGHWESVRMPSSLSAATSRARDLIRFWS